MPDAFTQEPLVVLDFAGTVAEGERERAAATAGSRIRMTSSRCARTVLVHDPSNVPAALDDVDAWCRSGGFAFGAVAYEAASAFDAACPARVLCGRPLLAFHLVPAADVVREVIPQGEAPGPVRQGGATPAAAATRPGMRARPDYPAAPAVPRYAGYPQWTSAESRERHAAVVTEVRERIANGDVYQVNHTVRLHAPWADSSLPFYEGLYAAHAPPYAAWMRFGELELLSMSPELFLERSGVHLTTRPMKGTARRGRFPGEDHARRAALLASEKERAENIMIVDLLRNDLGRLALPGGVRVESLLDAERHSTVWQLTSTIVARCAEPPSLRAAFTALFPSGSVTGAPRIAAMRQIARLEPEPRGFYCGAIGVVRPGGDYLFNVAIRTIQVDRASGSAVFGTGGGITWDSRPDAEFDELRAKAALVSEPVPEFDLLETLRLEGGSFPLLGRHIARLQRSAVHFGRSVDADRVRATLEETAEGHVSGVYRVRLLVDRTGRVTASALPFEADAQPWRVELAGEPVDVEDVFLFHKTTRRDVYDAALRGHPHADDVILWNRKGNLTELTRANLVVELDGELLTPPVEDGLLAGVQRELAMAERGVREASLTPHELERATAVWAINALRGWVPVSIRAPLPAGP